MKDFTYIPSGVCSRQITFDIEDGKLHNVSFLGGCDGNLKAIGMLLEGANAKETADMFRGNTCGFKSTSCADQLSLAIDSALAEG